MCVSGCINSVLFYWYAMISEAKCDTVTEIAVFSISSKHSRLRRLYAVNTEAYYRFNCFTFYDEEYRI